MTHKNPPDRVDPFPLPCYEDDMQNTPGKHLDYLALGHFSPHFLDRVDAILEFKTGIDVEIINVKGNDNNWTDCELRHAWAKVGHEMFPDDTLHLDGLLMAGGGRHVEQVTRYVGDLAHNDHLHTALLQWGDYDSDRVFTVSPNPDAFVDFAITMHDWLL